MLHYMALCRAFTRLGGLKKSTFDWEETMVEEDKGGIRADRMEVLSLHYMHVKSAKINLGM